MNPSSKKLEASFENYTLFKITVAGATDGADWKVSGIQCLLKKDVPNVVCVHCVVHRQHLVAKHLAGRLHEALMHVIKAVNLINKNAHCKNRLFQQLREMNNLYDLCCPTVIACIVLLHFGTVLFLSRVKHNLDRNLLMQRVISSTCLTYLKS